MHKRLIIVDISSFIFRAFYAIRPLHSPDGTPVNAVHGVLSMMLKLLSSYRPTHVFLAKDTRGGSFRNQMYSEYKANRSDPPDDLIPQFSIIAELLNKMKLPNCSIENFEADDLIGSAAVQWKDDFDEVYIASGDKDLMQFVGSNVKMLDTMKDKLYGVDEVFEKMGVRPDQIVDYLSMVGDSSDNIPGMKGIGAKGAAKLLAEHDTLEKCIEVKESFKGKKLIGAFENHLDDGLLSKKLIKIVTDIDLGLSPLDAEFTFSPDEELLSFMKGLGLKSLVKKVQDIAFNSHVAERSDEEVAIESLRASISQQRNIDVKSIFDSASIDEFISNNHNVKEFSVYFHYVNPDDSLDLNPIALSISSSKDNAIYIPIEHTDDFITKNSINNIDKLNLEKVLRFLFEKIENQIICLDSKIDRSYILGLGIEINAKIFDILLAHYIVDPSAKHEISYISDRYLNFDILCMDKKQKSIEDISYEDIHRFFGERSCSIFELSSVLNNCLEKNNLVSVYRNIDGPLALILNKMEHFGIMLNENYLSMLEVEFEETLSKIEKNVIDEVIELKGSDEFETINLKSPKQVGNLLFNILDMPIIKKTKTGASTDSEVLEELDSREINKIPSLIIQYREIDKLLSTYVKALPKLVNKRTKKIHTSFNQYVTATGRLSSVRPNLQNIPVRTENGRRIRKGFIATPGKILLSADYSQVELRLLAHFSEDPTMLTAFNNDEDIHAQTASEILGIPLNEVSSSDRSIAKTVNFGLMYGQSTFGLAKTLRISRTDAKNYITNYFQKFSKIKSYLDYLKEFCEESGYSVTLHGRKRFLPDIHSTNRNIKALAERMAINSPIQGTAADIIKLAMIEIDKEMIKRNLESLMVLQVHDELIFEVPENELEEMKSLIRDKMEHVVDLKVPLKVSMGVGVNWFDLK